MGLTHNASIVTDGLVLCLDAANKRSYPGSGTVWNDLGTNKNNGTLTNGPTFNAANGGSIVFDGSDDFVNISNNASLNISSAISLEAYIYPTKNNGIQNVICKSSFSQNTGYIYPRTDSGWSTSVFYLYISGSWRTLSVAWPSINAWHHTIATYDGATMKVYINGTLAGSLARTGAITTNTNSLIFGSQPGYTEFYGGRIAYARVYNRALSQAEITQNYNATRGRFL